MQPVRWGVPKRLAQTRKSCKKNNLLAEPELLVSEAEIHIPMKSFLKLAVPTVVFLGGLMVTSSLSFGKPEYTKKEKKGCTFCHAAANSKELNEVGKCYAANNHSLETCSPKK